SFLLSLSFLLLRPPPTSSLFPYTTLFRSRQVFGAHGRALAAGGRIVTLKRTSPSGGGLHPIEAYPLVVNVAGRARALQRDDAPRSEEHTSELQSQSNLVCRLLLEKKKKIN